MVYNTKRLSLDDLYNILENSEVLDKYVKLFEDVDKSTVITKIKDILRQNYDNNTIGARQINTLIHQYFIKGGKLEITEIQEVTFQKKLKL